MLLLYDLAMVDAIIMPISVATIASRNCELEHKGTTLKLLETMASPGALYGAKLAWGALVLAALLLVRWAIFAGVGVLWRFPGEIPWLQDGAVHPDLLGGVHDGLRPAAGAVPPLSQPGSGPGVRDFREFPRHFIPACSRQP